MSLYAKLGKYCANSCLRLLSTGIQSGMIVITTAALNVGNIVKSQKHAQQVDIVDYIHVKLFLTKRVNVYILFMWFYDVVIK